MIENVAIEPMTEDFILWRCLHLGPISVGTIDRYPSDDQIPWEHYRERNIPLLIKLTRTYGACAILARDGSRVVGQLRFYPKAVRDMPGAGGLCLQQDPPAGPEDDFTDSEFPPQKQMEEKTLLVHCMMSGSTNLSKNPYRRVGLGTRMVEVLIEWAVANGWDCIEVDAFEDLPIIYEITGSAGLSFWEKLGFRLVDRYPHPELRRRDWFVRTLEEQAKAAGIPPERARDKLVMRLDLARTKAASFRFNQT